MVANDLYPVDYRWPYDSLNSPTRIWEYPYIYHNILQLDITPDDTRILDIGSALTFFPFFLASKGYQVMATDINPQYEPVINNLIRLTPAMSFENLEYKTASCLNLEDIGNHGKYDIVISTSVIEHIGDKQGIIESIYKALTPNGYLILTYDLLWAERIFWRVATTTLFDALDTPQHNELSATISNYFTPVVPNILTPPLDMLGFYNALDISNRLEKSGRNIHAGNRYDYLRRFFYFLFRILSKYGSVKEPICVLGGVFQKL